MSTNPSALLGLYGSLGSDTFIITPQTVDPVVSKNLRGHRGIIEHEVISSTDEDYDGLVIRGIQADVLDNDGDYGWVLTVDQGGVVRSFCVDMFHMHSCHSHTHLFPFSWRWSTTSI